MSSTSPREIDAVVFDMDGTLIDSSSACPDAYIACMAAFGGPAITRDQVIEEGYPLGPPPNILRHFLGRDSTQDELDHYHAELGRLSAGVRVYDGIPEVLDELARSVPIAVFTGASTESCDILLTGPGLATRFAHLVATDRVERAKPHPDGLILTCELLGVAPERVAYVGDSPLDTEASRRCGALGVAAGWGHLYDADAPADLVAMDPRELPQLLGL